MTTFGDLIRFSTVIGKIRELARQYPDRIEPSSYFGAAGKPCCIFGHVLADFGVKPAEEKSLGYDDGDGYGYGDLLAPDSSAFAPSYYFASSLPWNAIGVQKPTGDEDRWISLVQYDHDNGARWARAVSSADKSLDWSFA